MKKILKKVVAFVSVAALAVGMISTLPTMTTKAASGDIKLYFKTLPTTTVADWGVNIWGGASLVDPNGGAPKPIDWQTGKVECGETLPGLNADDANWGYITVNGNVDGLQFVCAIPSTSGTVFNCWNSAIAALNLTEAYYNTDDWKWYREKDCINEIKMLDVAFEIDLVGGSSGTSGDEKFGNWNLDNAIKLTQNGNMFYTTIKQVPAGTYQFKFVQDRKQYGWLYQWGGTVDALSPIGGNISIEVTELSDVTFLFTEKAVKDNGDYDLFQITAATLEVTIEPAGISAEEVMAAINAIGDVTLNSKDAIEAAEAFYAAANAEEKAKVTNYSTLTEARAKYDELKAAEEEAGYDITIHFQNAEGWEKVNLYAFYKKGETQVDNMGSWPGTRITENTANPGWYSAAFNLNDSGIDLLTVIFNSASSQTMDTELNLVDGKGEFWIELTGETVAGAFGSVLETAIFTVAPDEWVESEIGEPDEETTAADEETTGTDEETTGTDEETTATDEETTGTDEETTVTDEETTGADKETTVTDEETTGAGEKATAAGEKTTTANADGKTTPQTGDAIPYAIVFICVAAAVVVVAARKKSEV